MKKVVILLLTIGLFSSCKKEENVPLNYEEAIEVEATNTESDTIVINTTVDTPIEEIRIWSNKESNLPIGEVVDYDCSKLGKKGQNMKDNYVLIRKPDNVFTIKRDVDIDLFCCIRRGDKIIE